MIVVEVDNDLAECVVDFFGGRYDVTRAATLEIASRELRSGTADVLFADIDPGTPADTEAIESLHQDHPDLKIIVTYLAPSQEEGWKARLSRSTNVLARKPYSVLDIDTTLKQLYGRQEGAVVGYNPKKPGRPSHVHHTYMLAGLRLVMGVETAPGNEHTGAHCTPGLWRLIDGLPRDCWPTLLRGDSGIVSENTMREAERRSIDYLFKLRQTKNQEC